MTVSTTLICMFVTEANYGLCWHMHERRHSKHFYKRRTP